MSEAFDCHCCKESLYGKKYIQVEEVPHCVPCYDRLYANTCQQCHQLIQHNSPELYYEERHYHEECFLCSRCSRSLADEPFTLQEEALVCNDCYCTQFSSQCVACRKTVMPGLLKIENVMMNAPIGFSRALNRVLPGHRGGDTAPSGWSMEAAPGMRSVSPAVDVRNPSVPSPSSQIKMSITACPVTRVDLHPDVPTASSFWFREALHTEMSPGIKSVSCAPGARPSSPDRLSPRRVKNRTVSSASATCTLRNARPATNPSQVLGKGSTSHSRSVSGISPALPARSVPYLWLEPGSFLMDQRFSAKPAMPNNPHLLLALHSPFLELLVCHARNIS